MSFTIKLSTTTLQAWLIRKIVIITNNTQQKEYKKKEIFKLLHTLHAYPVTKNFPTPLLFYNRSIQNYLQLVISTSSKAHVTSTKTTTQLSQRAHQYQPTMLYFIQIT
jgi:hypothetical protein